MALYSKIVTNKEDWNSYIKEINNQEKVTFLQSYEWLELQKEDGEDVFALAFFDDSDNIYGVAAAVAIRAKRGKYLYIRNGPLLKNWNDSHRVHEVFEIIKKIAKKEKLWFIRVSPLLEKNSLESDYLENSNYPISPMHDVDALDTWVWNLQNSSEDDLYSKIKKKTKYEIRKAEKKGAEVEITVHSKHTDTFYEILEDTVRRQGWNSHSKNFIKKEFRAFSESNLAFIVLVKINNEYASGGIFIEYEGSVHYHYGATRTKHLKNGAAYLMIWEAVKEAKRRDSNYFNFFGIAPANKPNHPWNGLTNFKMKFPGAENRWLPTRDIPLSPLYLLTNLYDRIDKIKKGY